MKPNRLTPSQIEALAIHIVEALRRHPITAPRCVVDPWPNEQQELWEVYLSQTVDADPSLPSYAAIEDDDEDLKLLEFLMEYYTR